MLVSLFVRDFALFSSAEFLPEEGFSALTGQTGAGKSLVVDALAFVMGARKGKEFIRCGSDTCEVRAVFSPVSEGQRRELQALGIETETDGIEFYRSLSSDARAVCRINGRVSTLSVLRRAATLFCDIHEQEDAHALLDPSRHLFYLDAFCPAEFSAAREEYRTLYNSYTEKKRAFQTLYSADKAEEKTAREFLEYQIRELESAKICVGEFAALTEKKQRLEHARRFAETTALVKDALSAEDGAYDRLVRASDALSAASVSVPEWKELALRLEEAAEAVSDVSRQIETEESNDPTAELDAIEARLQVLSRLFSLYAPDEEGLLSLLTEKKDRLYAIDHAKEEARRLHAEALAAREKAAEAAARLTRLRSAAAVRLQAEIARSLFELDMPAVRFEVRVTPREKICEDGLDTVEFYIGTNVGQPMLPLSAIASGGELSRVMLALRCVLSKSDGIGTLVFDEIDTGVSGKSAAKIGSAMRRLGRERQVLAVTHSAQVASAAHAQIKVEKAVENESTVARILPLTALMREEEIARILGGETVTETSLANARELIQAMQI